MKMIKNYDPNAYYVHTIRITLMQFDYTGHIAYKILGNCKGASLLDAETHFECDSQDIINNYVENDCNLVWHEDLELYSAVLTNADGDKLEINVDTEEIQDMVISIEIIEVEEE